MARVVGQPLSVMWGQPVVVSTMAHAKAGRVKILGVSSGKLIQSDIVTYLKVIREAGIKID